MTQATDELVFDGQLPENLYDEFSKQEAVYLRSRYALFTCMVMQLDDIFRKHPDVQSVQFFDRTSHNKGPDLMCLDTDGDDIGYMGPIQEIVDQWSESHHAAADVFMTLSDTRKLRRSDLVADRTQWIHALADRLPYFPKEVNTQWAQTLDSALKARDLRELADQVQPHRPKNKTPGL